jgi:hypothetical protein
VLRVTIGPSNFQSASHFKMRKAISKSKVKAKQKLTIIKRIAIITVVIVIRQVKTRYTSEEGYLIRVHLFILYNIMIMRDMD